MGCKNGFLILVFHAPEKFIREKVVIMNLCQLVHRCVFHKDRWVVALQTLMVVLLEYDINEWFRKHAENKRMSLKNGHWSYYKEVVNHRLCH